MSSQAEMEGRREPSSRPEVEEEERPLETPSSAEGRQKEKEALEDGDVESRIAEPPSRRRTKPGHELRKAQPPVMESHSKRGAGDREEAQKSPLAFTHRAPASRPESVPPLPRERRRKTKVPGYCRPRREPSRGTARNRRTCCRCCTDRDRAAGSSGHSGAMASSPNFCGRCGYACLA